MSSPTSLLNDGDGVHPQNHDALVTVLGVCLLIIGLCSFAGIVLLLQQFQRSGPAPDAAPTGPVLARRSTKPTAATTQFRPLSETLRHRGDPTRRTSLERGSAVQYVPPGAPPKTLAGALGETLPPNLARTSIGRTPPAAPVSPPAAAAATAPPSTAAVAAALAATAPFDRSEAAAAAAAASVGSTSGSVRSGVGGCGAKSATRSIDDIDISLLSRIDEALASGYMRPHQATQLLKSYGCDLEELLKVELSDSSVDGGADCVPAGCLESAPSLGNRSAAASAPVTAPAAALSAADATPVINLDVLPPPPAAAAASQRRLRPPPPPLDGSGAAPRAAALRPAAPTVPPRPPGGLSALCKEGSDASSSSSSSLLASGGGAAASGSPPAALASVGGGAGGGTIIDDALLRKIDLALASGCVRPEQATQLLMSYGCDLEELLREEEVGEGAQGLSRKSSSGLSG